MTRQILSPDNQYIRLAASLRHRKYREETGFFIVEGLRLVQEALESSWTFEYAMVADEQGSSEQIRNLTEDIEVRGCPVLSVPLSLYRKVSDTENPQGILAVVRQKRDTLENISTIGQSSLWVILDSLQDPGNVGTIVRTADAAGAAGVILTEGCADLYAGKTTRATMGSLFHIPVVKASVEECSAFCSRQELSLYLACSEASARYSEVDLTSPCAIVFGNEGSGVGEYFRNHTVLNLKIPIVGKAESLNVACAAAVILFEAARQRGLTL